MKAAGYVRVSTEEQAREGYGLAAQEQSIRAYCQAQGWELIEVYADAGRSGKSTKGRESLARLLADADAGRFQRVVFWKLDRLGRNLRDLLETCDRLEGLGVGVVSIQESIDTGTPGGRMMRSVLGALAEFEREAIIERTRAGMAEKKRRGEWVGKVPVGFRQDNGRLSPDIETAPLVRTLFEKYADGCHSLRQLVPWTTEALGLSDYTAVRYVLTNDVYAGVLVDKGLFDRVQAEITRRATLPPQRPYGRNPYPLSGIARCSACREPLMGSHGYTRYMRCRTTHRRGKAACSQPMVKAEPLERQIAHYVSGMRLPPQYVDGVAEELRQRQSPSVDVAKLRREIERWRRLYVLGEIDERRLKRELTPLKGRLADADRPLVDIHRALSYLRDVGSLWAESPRHLQREFVHEVFDRIEVEGPDIMAITPKDTFSLLFAIDRRERYGGVMELIRPTASR